MDEYIIKQLICIGSILLGFTLGGVIGFLRKSNEE